VRRLAAVDAQMYWMSAQVPNDQFLLYAFAASPDRLDPVLDGLTRRAAECADLRLRLTDGDWWRYPRWESGAVTPEQFVVHEPLAWDDCLSAVAALAEDQLDPRVAAWRLHLFGSVVVLQIAHCLADGTRAADLAAWLLGRDVPVPPLPQTRRGSLALRSVTAARAHRAMVRDIAAGRLPPPRPSQPPGPTNSAPAGRRQVRTLLRQRSELGKGRTVTVTVLAAIGDALDGYLRARGCGAAPLSAEVLLAKPGIRLAGNHFRNTGVGLYPDLEPGERATTIDADLRAGRQRAQHPAALAADRAFTATPAALLRWGVGHFDPAARAPLVTGATVVSSVNRGPADLRFGTAPVRWTSGYPALSPMMGLTHGVHGIGDTIAVSVHGAESAVDIDDYVDRLARALG
jgi:hypothetical protein